jgi:hypothetical protein
MQKMRLAPHHQIEKTMHIRHSKRGGLKTISRYEEKNLA